MIYKLSFVLAIIINIVTSNTKEWDPARKADVLSTHVRSLPKFDSVNLDDNNIVPLKRKKRLVFGITLRSTESYLVTQYQAAIFPGQFCTHEMLKKFALFNKGKAAWKNYETFSEAQQLVGNIVKNFCSVEQVGAECTGAAISRDVVQTACHCVARPIFRGVTGEEYKELIGMKVLSAFEDFKLVHIGQLRLDGPEPPHVVKKFISHPKCKYVLGFKMYDFGLIVLKKPLDHDVGPPVPSIQSLRAQTNYIKSNELICMVVGWGYSTAYEGHGLTYYGDPSHKLQHGWRMVMNAHDCYMIEQHAPFFDQAFQGNLSVFKAQATWVCHKAFGKQRTLLLNGDSGAPMTCLSELYFAMHHWSMEFNVPGEVFPLKLDVAGEVEHVLDEVSFEYRGFFESFIKSIQTDYHGQVWTMYDQSVPGIQQDQAPKSQATTYLKFKSFQWSLILPVSFYIILKLV